MSSGDVAGFCRASLRESEAIGPADDGAGLGGGGLAGADPFAGAGSGAFPAERLKKPVGLRIVLAIESRQRVPDRLSEVVASARRKEPLSGRIIPVLERGRRLLQRIDRRPGERGGRGRRAAGLPGRRAFLRLKGRLGGWRNSRLRLAFVPGAGRDRVPLLASLPRQPPPLIPAVLRPMTRKLRFVRGFPQARKSSLKSTRRPSRLSASDVSSIPSCALNRALRIFCGGALASPRVPRATMFTVALT